jgi:hypothetical protein
MVKYSEVCPQMKDYDADKVSIDDVLNEEISIKDFSIGQSHKFNHPIVKVLASYNNRDICFITSSAVIIEQLGRIKQYLPVETIIVKKGKYYTLT